jgi:hypothetical protein
MRRKQERDHENSCIAFRSDDLLIDNGFGAAGKQLLKT